MKNFFKPARIGFYLLMLIAFFIIGLYFAGFIDAGKGQGLAGGGITHYRYIQHQNAKEESEQFKPAPTTPTPQTEPIGMVTFYKDDASHSIPIKNPIEENDAMGLGFFKPNFFQYPTLFFYGNVTHEKSVSQHTPTDSLALGRDQFGDFTLISGPPWLWPEAMNSPFGIFYFKVKTVGREFIEVEVNSKNGQTAYLNKRNGELLFWPEFLLTVSSIEFIEGKTQVPKIKPLDYAGEVNTPYVHLNPLQVKDEWVQLILKDKNFREVGKGWVRWRTDGELLIKYELPNI